MNHPLFAGIGGHHSARSKTDEWLTPVSIIDALGGADSFDLDPCTPAVQPWPTARHRYTKSDNGLLRAWQGRVWLNPPYGRFVDRWMKRMAHHDHGVALIFARTETDSFFRFVWDTASAILFIRGRLNFHVASDTWIERKGRPPLFLPAGSRAPSNSGAPSVLIAYGPADADVLAFCGIDGQFLPLRLPRLVVVAIGDQTWLEALAAWLTAERGPVPLDELYRAFASHPKARGKAHWRPKLRQVLQHGPFRRVDRGVWEATC